MNRQILEQPLDQLLEAARSKFEVEFAPISINGRVFELLQITNMTEYVDRLADASSPESGLELPFWAKIWPSCVILGYHVMRIPPGEGKTAIEIGAGGGLAGLAAAARGYEVVISDLSDDALLFARINILKNNLEKNARVERIDFTTQKLEQKFDLILGCEVLYQDEAYRPLVKFILRHLKPTPDSEAVLAIDYKRKAKKFFQLAKDEFLSQEKIIGFKQSDGSDGQEKHLCKIVRMKHRKM